MTTQRWILLCIVACPLVALVALLSVPSVNAFDNAAQNYAASSPGTATCGGSHYEKTITLRRCGGQLSAPTSDRACITGTVDVIESKWYFSDTRYVEEGNNICRYKIADAAENSPYSRETCTQQSFTKNVVLDTYDWIPTIGQPLVVFCEIWIDADSDGTKDAGELRLDKFYIMLS